MAAEDEISPAGRRARFERWEGLGLERVKPDLLSGNHQFVAGAPAVRELAWEWVRMSTDHQKYSIENQSVENRTSAANRGMEIVRTCADASTSRISDHFGGHTC